MDECLREGNVRENPSLNESYFGEFEQLFEGYTATVRSFTQQKAQLKRFIGIFSQFDPGTIKKYFDIWINTRIDGLRKYAQQVNVQIG
ncbi:hypothetical protein HY637_04755 [Candidatus Woesearchaeota archaeon]|nr:hypothetical protein [Candidatus Woesearchaeota archaeon]